MDVFFYAVPGLIMAVAISMAVAVIRRSLDMNRAWSSGLTAEARCLRSFTTTSGGGGDTSVSTTLHHVYEFRARDGRTVRFEEENGPATIIEGDIVTVHYIAERPEKATAHTPSRGKLAAGTVGILIFCTVIVLFCIGFMVSVHGFFSMWDSAGSGGDEFEGTGLPF
ncbi:DUF3592 domain-containing protein [Streptomyces sp. NBC_00365]|uniref:DUF3592 domain-containing protein n=1 Tax=unclassified Streptomyces TaxID=2593676 RepID=UPI00225A3ED8|nr:MULTISPECIES: DUF3592 domain-containing protein [unclassified Streptomyces]MCX5090490.1 DUF3592 domain-containing protein [Streptomyces sp. NBC_00365]